jgi:hypothetical protein
VEKRSSFIVDLVVPAVLVLGWLTLVHVIWIAQPSMSANLNPVLPVHCNSEMLFDCTMEAERTFWNYNTDMDGATYTMGMAAVLMIAISLLSWGISAAFLKLLEPLAQKFFFTNPWLIYKIRNRPVREPYVADDPQQEAEQPQRQ